MKSRRAASIKSRIFLSYGFIILMLIISACLLYYFTAYNAFMENYTNNSRQLSKIVSQQVDSYLDSINDVQKKLLESDDIRDYIFEGAAQRDPSLDREFRSMVYMITGYDLPFFHMNILNMEGDLLIPFGNRYDPLSFTPDEAVMQNIITPACELRGGKLLTPPGSGVLFRTQDQRPTLSLVRSFTRYSSSLSDPRGIMEIQISLDDLGRLVRDMLFSYENRAESVILFDNNRNLLFPGTLPDSLAAYYTQQAASQSGLVPNPVTHEKELTTAYHSDAYGITTLIVTPETSLLSNTRFFRNMALLIAGISLLLLVAITYRLARSISLPIIAMKDSISRLQLDTLSSETPYRPDSSLDELEMLSSAYGHMQQRLKKSLDDVVQARTLTIHSQLMAMQAQMDSHFLYNTLTIISIIAEENNDTQASEMCLKLTRMLRYISSDSLMASTLLEEWNHARNYTDLMAIRFGDKIRFSYEMGPDMKQLTVPRLIIQPLIENCVKYSRSDDRTLAVTVRAFTDDTYWYTRITDNGPGFTPEAVAAVYEKINRLDTETEYPQMSINGMGLVNIYLRLKLFYNNRFVFRIEKPDRGAAIIIGGELSL